MRSEGMKQAIKEAVRNLATSFYDTDAVKALRDIQEYTKYFTNEELSELLADIPGLTYFPDYED